MTTFSYTNWLENFFTSYNQIYHSNHITFSQLALPGTHHSGVTVQGLTKLFQPWTVCQNLSPQDQFNIGVRFFHFAVSDDYWNGNVYIKHYFGSRLFKQEIQKLKQCLNKNKKQIIIIYIKKDSRSRLSVEGLNKVIQIICNAFNEIGIISKKLMNQNIAEWYKNNDFPGRVVISGLRKLQNKKLGEEYIWGCPNSYWETKSDNRIELIQRLKSYMKNYRQQKYGLHNLECIITLNLKRIIFGRTIFKESMQLKNDLYKLWQQRQLMGKWNIIMMDNINEQDIRRIMELNYKRFKIDK